MVGSALHVSVFGVLIAAEFFQSDDGLCAIDVNHMQYIVHDTATNHDISAAAKSVLDKCVFRDGAKTVGNIPIGGSLGYVGQYSVFFTRQNREVLFLLFFFFSFTDSLLAFTILGRRHGLSVRVTSYSPEVKCDTGTGHEDERACLNLVGILPVGLSRFVFTREKTTGEKSVIIPSGGRNIASGTHSLLPAFLRLCAKRPSFLRA